MRKSRGPEVRTMIARFWRATTRPGMGESYLDYLRQTGLRGFRETPGWEIERARFTPLGR